MHKIKLNDLKIGDIIFISKCKSGFQHMLECKYIGLKKGRISGEIIKVEPEWAKFHYNESVNIICNKNKCSIRRQDKQLSKKVDYKWIRHHWLNPKTLEFE